MSAGGFFLVVLTSLLGMMAAVIVLDTVVAVIDFFTAKRCGHCGGRDMRRGTYTRGYNELCRQAAGDSGWFCMNCCKIEFENSRHQWLKTKPKWVKDYGR